MARKAAVAREAARRRCADGALNFRGRRGAGMRCWGRRGEGHGGPRGGRCVRAWPVGPTGPAWCVRNLQIGAVGTQVRTFGARGLGGAAGARPSTARCAVVYRDRGSTPRGAERTVAPRPPNRRRPFAPSHRLPMSRNVAEASATRASVPKADAARRARAAQQGARPPPGL